MKIEIGCGMDKTQGYVHCDISKECNPDIILDLNKKLPFKDNEISEVIMNHVLEHTKDRLKSLDELYRVCKDGAIIKIRVPYFTHVSANTTLDHYGRFTYTSFDSFNKSKENKNKNHKNYYWWAGANFKTIKKELHFRPKLKLIEWIFKKSKKFQYIYEDYLCYLLPAKELEVWLKVVKK
jgi:predicted SAM-dependent methyltransferase